MQILTYHSISEDPGPTSIPVALFRAQMDAIAASGQTVVSLDLVPDWIAGRRTLPDACLAITFDDGFVDFATHAAPLLASRGWPATVFLPTGKMGGPADWPGEQSSPPRPLLSWDAVRALYRSGITFGGHSVTHAKLSTLPFSALEQEVRDAQSHLQRELGVAPTSFAPPYGASNAQVIAMIRRFYAVSCGTRLARVAQHDDPHDLPRIEMHYFRDPDRWSDYLLGRAEGYFRARRALRSVRQWLQAK